MSTRLAADAPPATTGGTGARPLVAGGQPGPDGARTGASSAGWESAGSAGSGGHVRESDVVLGEHLLGIAVGIVVAQRRCSPARALGVLADLAARTGRTVTEEADRLVERHSRSTRSGRTRPARTAGPPVGDQTG